MASFNISKGLEASLPSTKTDGKMYFCTDTGNIYIDYKDGNNILRKLINKQILDAKQDAITGAASTIANSNLTANRVLLSNSSGKVAASAVTNVELSYLDGVTSNIQTQLDGKLSKTGGELTGNITLKADASGSPSIVLQRGTSSDAYTDWRIQDSVGQLKFGTRSNSSDFTDKIVFREAGNIEATSFIGNLSGNADTATKATKDGSGNTITSTYATKTALNTLDAAYDAHKHTVYHVPAGTVSKPTFTGSAVNSGTPSGTTSVYSITGVGSAPSLTATVSNKCLTLSWSAGSVPTRSSVTVASSEHKHSVTASGTVSQPTFTGTGATLTSSTPA